MLWVEEHASDPGQCDSYLRGNGRKGGWSPGTWARDGLLVSSASCFHPRG
jgi:hypothetical protein